MFAYCNNGPVNYKDPYGLFRFLDYALFDYLAMHTMTQIKCAYDYGFAMEVYVKTGDQKGRLDLYDPVNNMFYEVKSDGCKDSDDTKEQINRYTASVIQDTNGNIGKLGLGAIGKTPEPGNNTKIKGSFEYWIYDVEYKYYSPGLIIYSKQTNMERASVLALCGVIAVAGVLSGGAAFAIGAGALAAGYIY